MNDGEPPRKLALGLALHSSASAELPTLRRQKGTLKKGNDCEILWVMSFFESDRIRVWFSTNEYIWFPIASKCIKWQSSCSGASASSLVREKVYEECSVEIQDGLTDSVLNKVLQICAVRQILHCLSGLFSTCPLFPFRLCQLCAWTLEIASLKSKGLLSGVQMRSACQIGRGAAFFEVLNQTLMLSLFLWTGVSCDGDCCHILIF